MDGIPKRLRMKDLVELGVVPSKKTGYDWIKRGILPPGKLTGPNVRSWTENEIAEHLLGRPSGLKAAPRGRPRTEAHPAE